MMFIFTEEKWNNFIKSGRLLSELIYENNKNKIAISKSEKELVKK